MTAVLRVIRAALQPIREKEMPCRAISNSSDKLSFHCCSLVTAEMLDLRCSNWHLSLLFEVTEPALKWMNIQ